MENTKLIAQARSANEGRSMMKQFRGRHKDLEKGDDIRNPQHLINQKEKRLTQRMKNMSKEQRKSNGSARPSEKFTGGRSYSQKSRNKIVAGMRPTRSKQIVKTAGREGGFSFKGKRGGRGRGGKR